MAIQVVLKSIFGIITALAVILAGFIATYSAQSKLVGAFLVGFLGSVAYITALYFKFIGVDDNSRSIISEPFCKPDRKISILKCVWYGFVGGCIAVIFQFDVPNFVAIQSLILGATWPAVVANFLSGRLSAPNKEEQETRRALEGLKGQQKSNKNQKDDIAERIKNIGKNKKQ